MKSVVSSKGQITLPAEIRAKLGLVTGTPVQFEVRDGEVVLRKGVRGSHPVDQLFGRLRLPKPVDALLDVLGADSRFGERSREALRAAYDAGAPTSPPETAWWPTS